MNSYRADYEDENFEMITAASNDEAITKGFGFEEEHGILFNVTLVDEDYNDVETIF